MTVDWPQRFLNVGRLRLYFILQETVFELAYYCSIVHSNMICNERHHMQLQLEENK